MICGRRWLLLAAVLVGVALPARAGQYELFDYYVQQMIALAAAADATGVQAFREQLDGLGRPEAGDTAQVRPLLQQGLDYLNRDQRKEALAAFRQAFIADPADPEIADQLGLTYLRLQRLKEAERLLVYALALAPTRTATWLHLGQTYGQAGDADRATGAFANAHRFAQDPAGLAAQLQQLATTDPAEAIRLGAQRALQLTPAKTAASVVQRSPLAAAPPSSAPIAPTTPKSGGGATPAPSPPNHNALLEALRQRFAALKPPGSAPVTPTATRDSPGQQIYQNSIPRTCLIVNSRDGKTASLGSGLLVSADGLVITNNHVVENAEGLAVKCGQRESVARISKRSREPDLALLTTSFKEVESFVLDETYSQDLVGRDIFVIGNPYGLEGTFSTGVISGLRQIDGVRYIQISAPISAGNSGGPVILRDGSVIGVTTMALKKGQNINFAIAAVELTRSPLFDPA
ncbi:MAG: trypsin-like peptidase domain-containing protein, partial [Candidatus Contendobacter sp.]